MDRVVWKFNIYSTSSEVLNFLNSFWRIGADKDSIKIVAMPSGGFTVFYQAWETSK